MLAGWLEIRSAYEELQPAGELGSVQPRPHKRRCQLCVITSLISRLNRALRSE